MTGASESVSTLETRRSVAICAVSAHLASRGMANFVRPGGHS